ncbi:FAD-binding oxidoreductase [Saprospira grandis]|uniref:(S)-2-hydroxy-acid oxidase n=1 Tax=Saprospira grandis (strain Lewin) TaxID=984262 RepID=H6L109_SAPGL|nr:FAD-linked oxidase C-terminal domain-containing protein [Saprospira grandis]AFC26045.1 (S)-2-hydroxy-acid oxidase [Saprospira grandis str. Lewin]
MSIKRRILSEAEKEALAQFVAPENAASAQEILAQYGQDHTEDLCFLAEILLKPARLEELQAIVRYCWENEIPITPRGAGTGLAGGALPVAGGVLLSMENFNQIVEIDEENLQVTVEAGVITEELQNTLAEKGLYYPPDPASRGWSFIGGNIATNAGGPRALKYGVVKDYVLNLQLVLADGSVIWTGANTLKNSTGFNLTQLIVGSEGCLGIVVRAVLRLIPLPSKRLLMLAPFRSAEGACAAVSAIFRAGITPSALEFMERAAIDRAIEYMGGSPLPVPEETAAQLIIEVDGHYLEPLYADCEKIQEVLDQFDCIELLFADNEEQQRQIWQSRRNVGQAVKSHSIYKEEDTVVPRAKLPQLLAGVKEIGAKYGFSSICYGHAGDGNLHVNIIKGQLSEDAWQNELPKGIREIFELTTSLGGTISGEHGIGLVQRPYMDIAFAPTALQLLKNIKTSFDPKGILNPYKVL